MTMHTAHWRQVAMALAGAALLFAQAGPDAVAGWIEARQLRTDAVTLARRVPPRPPGAVGGAEFARRIENVSGPERERRIVAEILAGNIPEFLRELHPVQIDVAGPAATHATFWVMPDYLAIGSDEDFLRVPMGLDSAATIARAFDMTLPTREMVDAIYEHAQVRLVPQPMPPTAAMTSTAYFVAHNAAIEKQRHGGQLGWLTAGQKKDLVLTNRLLRVPGRVAIYGWHRPDGNPIQPLSTVHGATYADYSHGVRLVGRQALLQGKRVDVFDVLSDPQRAGLFSAEGAIGDPSGLLEEAARR